MAAAVALEGVDAHCAYLALPQLGERMGPGGFQAVVAQAMKSPVLGFFQPIQGQASRELKPVIAELRGRLSTSGPLALIGGSMGAASVLTALAETDVQPVAVSLLVPAVQMRPLIDGMNQRFFGADFAWSDEASAAARRFDFLARAKQLSSGRTSLAFQCITGAEDAPFLRDPAEQLRSALLEAGVPEDRLEWVRMEGLQHALAEPPGLDAAPQTTSAKKVDALVTSFLTRRLR
jgi:acetyl esterase/lipase